MKKLKVVGILAAVVLIGGVVSIPLINNHTAIRWKRHYVKFRCQRKRN